MARMFDPGRPVVSAATRVIEARQIMSMLSEHEVADKTRFSYTKACVFIEDMAAKLALGGIDVLVTDKQLEWLRGLCEQFVGHLPEDEDNGRRRKVAWKR